GVLISNQGLMPLIGGSGGGGAGQGLAAGCTASSIGGGGGGGSGSILIAADGTIAVNGTIQALGGIGGCTGAGLCFVGGSGSAGAIRLVADTISGSGTLRADSPNLGAIREEAFNISFPVSGSSPVAARVFAPGAISEPLPPRLAVTAVSGQT